MCYLIIGQFAIIWIICQVSINWFKSYLTGRTQQVKINRTLSSHQNLKSGVPQGGILSPILFVIYGAGLEKWLKYSTAHNYADDTESGTTAKTLEEVKLKLEEDARNVLQFMASNGLKANPSKTTLMLLNGKNKHYYYYYYYQLLGTFFFSYSSIFAMRGLPTYCLEHYFNFSNGIRSY